MLSSARLLVVSLTSAVAEMKGGRSGVEVVQPPQVCGEGADVPGTELQAEGA